MRLARLAVGIISSVLVLLTADCGKEPTEPKTNTAPTASFTMTPTSGTTDTVFHFDASGSSDAEDTVSVLEVRWDWENDGTWDTSWSATKTAEHQYGAEGTEIVKLEVKDTGGLADDTTRVLTVSLPNTAPTASFTVSPESGTTETNFQFDASGSFDAEDAASALEVRWDWENDGVWDVDWTMTKTASHMYGDAGTDTVRLEVKDAGEMVDDTMAVVTVSLANTAPVASFTISPATGTMDTMFSFDASGSSDAEDAISALRVRWDWENDGTWDIPLTRTKTATHRYRTTGQKIIRLQVLDVAGLTDDTTETVTVTGKGGMVLVPAGTFEMGDGAAECGTNKHQVTLTHSFYLDKYEVTNEEYRIALQWAYDHGYVTATSEEVNDNLDGSTLPLVNLTGSCQISFSVGVFVVDAGKGDYPMVQVNWYGAVAYCDWLSLMAGLTKAYDHSTWLCNGGNPYTAEGYRLPTDAEWEYATQCGGERRYPWGNRAPDCSRANFSQYYPLDYCVGATSAVGSCELGKSYLGLYDMAGNAWEWCNDWHTCLPSETEDPTGPPTGSYRVLRGGCWWSGGEMPMRCAFRDSDDPSDWSFTPGFRCARSQ